MGGRRLSGSRTLATPLLTIILFTILCTGVASSQLSGLGGGSGSGSGSSSGLGISCSSLGVGSCFAGGSITQGNAGIGYETTCIPYDQCVFLNESFSWTFYTYNAGNGMITKSPISGLAPNPIPVISDVIKTNDQSSPYLITCPVSPNATNTIEYISDPGTFIAGNRCLASVTPLMTTVNLTTTVKFINWGYFLNISGFTVGSAPTSASNNYGINGMARGSIQDIGYSGQSTVGGASTYNISSSYNTHSYIFQGVNSTPQQGLWTWTADYGNLKNQNLGYLNLTYNSSNDESMSELYSGYIGFDLGELDLGVIPIIAPFPVLCLFQYSFQIHSWVSNLTNINLPIPVYNTTANKKSYLKIGDYIYSPTWTASGISSTCQAELLSGGPGCSTAKSSLLNTFTAGVAGTKSYAGNWLKISTNATAYYNGQTYNNLPLYVGLPNNTDINELAAYYGVVVGCGQYLPRSTGRSAGFRTVCTTDLYLPQSVSQNVNGQTDTGTILQYLESWAKIGGGLPGVSIVQVSNPTGGPHGPPPGAPGSCSLSSGVGGLSLYPYSVSTAESASGYQLQYCVTASTRQSQAQLCSGFGLTSSSCAIYVGVSDTPLGGNIINISYIVPIPGVNGAGTLLETNSVSGVDFHNVSVFPYFVYNAIIPSTYSQLTPPSYLSLSYGIYSPNNYAGTANEFGVTTTPIEPYNLFSGAGLLANYSTKTRPSELVDFPFSVTADSGNTFYDEFPTAIGATQAQTRVPIANVTVINQPGITFNDLDISTSLGANSLLSPIIPSSAVGPILQSLTPQAGAAAAVSLSKVSGSYDGQVGLLRYPPNTIIYVTSQLDSQSGLPMCSNDVLSGACIGGTNFTQSESLSGNLFVFGPINYTPGTILATNGYSIITNVTIPDSSFIIQGYRSGTASVTAHGTLGFFNISNPAYIAESPNGYVYVLNYTSKNGYFGLSTTTNSFLFKLKYIPQGDYNYSVYQPSEFTLQGTLGRWINQSENYFRGALLAGTPSMYVIGSSEFSGVKAPNLCLFGECLGGNRVSGNAPVPLIPLAIAADSQGDIFFVGAPIPSVYPSSGDFALAELTAGGTIIEDNAISQPAGFNPSSEMAVSPSGQYVFLANASYPSINVYSTAGGSFNYVTNIPLSYSNSTMNLNITKYLADGGPFNSSVFAAEYPSVANGGTINDIAAFHHPLQITDAGGILFVLDDWVFGGQVTTGEYTGCDPSLGIPCGSSSTTSPPVGAVWMLRAFTDNGVELPLGYSSQNTTVPTSSVAQLITPSYYGSLSSQLWPPYGEPLTANITASTNVYWSICEYGCSATANAPFISMGPQISTSGAVTASPFGYAKQGATNYNPENLGISSDYEGNIYLMIHDNVGPSPYAELLELRGTVQNYTSLDVGSGVPFQCFANVPGTPNCMTANFISNLYPPLIGMPDSFEFLSGQGSAQQYLSVPSTLASVLQTIPSGTSASSEFNNGPGGGQNYNTLATESLPNTPVTGNSQLRTYINSTINGYVVTPYRIVYNLQQSWAFQSGTELFETPSVDYFESSVCAYNPNPKSGSHTIYSQVVTPLTHNFINQSIEGGGTYPYYNTSGANYQANLSDANLILPPYIAYSVFTNRLLGEIYINQTINSSYVSSVTAQLEQYLGQNLLGKSSGGLGGLGSQLSGLACSLGVTSSTGSFCPKVINATRNYNYTEDVYVQTIDNPLASGFGKIGGTGAGGGLSSWNGILSIKSTCAGFCAPAYLAQNAIPTWPAGSTPNNTIIGADCGGKGCPSTIASTASTDVFGITGTSGLGSQVGALTGLSGYYYGKNYVSANNIFNYSDLNQTNYFQLFSQYKRSAYLYGLSLNLSVIPAIYGYNRLTYTYVDRYNNTILMPVDVDFANITLVTVGENTTVNQTNFNQSTLNITGSLQYLAANGVLLPAPTGSKIYLYYDTNLNYYNTTALTSLAEGSSVSSILSGGYDKWAENCAFDPQSVCVLANPLNTFGLSSLLQASSYFTGQSQSGIQNLASTALTQLSDNPTYYPEYQSGSSCAPQPNSLLAYSQDNCNIHGQALTSLLPSNIRQDLSQYGGILPSSALGPNGHTEYCLPEYSNGTGYLTSQIGLIGTVTTNSAGDFNEIITACGQGSGRVEAQFYGSPGPEPIPVVQTSLPHSAVALSANTANDVISMEYNYLFAPNETGAPYQIGAYQLSVGNLYAWIPIIIIIILLLASKTALGQQGSIFELFGFSVIADMAAGIGAGRGGKGKGLRGTYKTASLPGAPWDRLKQFRTARAVSAAKRPPPMAPTSNAALKATAKKAGMVKLAVAFGLVGGTASMSYAQLRQNYLRSMKGAKTDEQRTQINAAWTAVQANQGRVVPKGVVAGAALLGGTAGVARGIVADPWEAHMRDYYKGLRKDNTVKIKTKDRQNIEALFQKVADQRGSPEGEKARMGLWAAMNGVYLKNAHHLKRDDGYKDWKVWKKENKALMDKTRGAKSPKDLNDIWVAEMSQHVRASAGGIAPTGSRRGTPEGGKLSPTNENTAEYNARIGAENLAPKVDPKTGKLVLDNNGNPIADDSGEHLTLNQWSLPGAKGYAEFAGSSKIFREHEAEQTDKIDKARVAFARQADLRFDILPAKKKRELLGEANTPAIESVITVSLSEKDKTYLSKLKSDERAVEVERLRVKVLMDQTSKEDPDFAKKAYNSIYNSHLGTITGTTSPFTKKPPIPPPEPPPSDLQLGVETPKKQIEKKPESGQQ